MGYLMQKIKSFLNIWLQSSHYFQRFFDLKKIVCNHLFAHNYDIKY